MGNRKLKSEEKVQVSVLLESTQLRFFGDAVETSRESRSVSSTWKVRVFCSFSFFVFESRKEHNGKVTKVTL